MYTRDEVLSIITDTADRLGDNAPELNYWAFSTYTLILPEIVEQVSLALPQSSLSAPLWNYLDACASILKGGSQLADDNTHRPLVTKIKGLFNISSGVQLAVLTGISATTLGGPAFAAAFGASFLLSLDDTIRAARRLYDVNYWTADNLRQLKTTYEVIDKLRQEIETLSSSSPKNIGAVQWALNHKKERLKAIEKNKQEVESEIIARINCNIECLTCCTGIIAKIDHPAFNQIKAILTKPVDLNPLSKEKILQNAADERNAIEKCKKELKGSTKNTLIVGTAFVGMLLLCIPGAQLAGVITVSIATAMYLQKHHTDVKTFAQKVKDRVFSFFKGRPALSASNDENISRKKAVNNR